MVKLAVFDCDGTLIDSQRNIILAMSESFARHGLAPPEDHATRRVVGLSLVEAMQALLPQAEPALQERLALDYKTAFQRLRGELRLEPEPMYPGIHDLLERLHGDGWLLAVATGKSDRGLSLALAHHGIDHLFVSLQTADRHPSKPHPAMLRAALGEAGAKASQAVIIGDTVFDVMMGVRGGVRAVGVDWGYHDAGELIEAGADGVASDAAHLWELLHG
ncbi:haloacid dehalogenase [Polymorphobacter multimanifer]|uniref:Phosphoglycolate phosphatase n=1 Tax=Polymorphobacter multimanifer TaxID=1070431 RepID=A0A841L7E6_9SPHN|nr:HAD-IA family hydrolase [Polymorphobacter multimanifer]MBB6228136.1 phosphoglycolate phosphatase [Polymorphobacter multimanifer]GGI69832.1 haloacid dehalogenase [Polymorphobacter multimanifer]